MKKVRSSWKNRDEDDEGAQEWEGDVKKKGKKAKRPRDAEESNEIAEMKRRLEIDMNIELEDQVNECLFLFFPRLSLSLSVRYEH